ncbi:unnamed protein product [Medioppia subpectinata]|uniref:Acyltransferase 3 domain-containing protein n=1 Tax=Medioppia subpectinata TaxID=1979941 RepID=A0A7R9KV09_9ACAR|nr:unnamed protein product [Medioppia subpectinata]CAG2110212.1 unnamed protein product [Medioppia subpectinata]
MSIVMDITFTLNGIACGKWFRHQLDANRHKTFTRITTRYYFERILRIIPIYYISLYFVAMNVIYFAPHSLYNRQFISLCQTQMPIQLTFVANLISDTKICFPESWSLCVLIQFVLLTPVLMYLTYRNFKTGIMAIIMTGLVCMVTTLYIDYTTDYRIKTRYITAQIKPFTHGVPYLAGLLYGYLTVDEQLNKHIRAYRFGGLMPGALQSPALIAVHMVYTGVYAVIICLSVIIYTDSHNTSLCNRFLSSRWWRPIRSIQLTSYLLHDYFAQHLFNALTAGLCRTVPAPVLLLSAVAANCLVMAVVSAVFELPFGRLQRSLSTYVFGDRRTGLSADRRPTHKYD